MARPKKIDAKRERVPGFRTTKRIAARIRWLAKQYAGGSVSRWLEYAALEAPRKRLR